MHTNCMYVRLYMRACALWICHVHLHTHADYACAYSCKFAHTYTYTCTDTRIDTYTVVYKNAHARVQELKQMPNAEAFFDRKDWFHESAVSHHRSGVPPPLFFARGDHRLSDEIDMMMGGMMIRGPRRDPHPVAHPPAEDRSSILFFSTKHFSCTWRFRSAVRTV
jgi:hypothetical protein